MPVGINGKNEHVFSLRWCRDFNNVVNLGFLLSLV